MKTFTTNSGITIQQVLSGRNNVFLIITENGNILVDTGMKGVYKRLTSNIANRAIDLLILTHSHFDHCQNAHKLKQQFGCPILSNSAESKFSQKGFTPLPAGTNSFTRLLIRIGNKLNQRRFSYTPFLTDLAFNKDIHLSEYDNKLAVIATPGHSIGSISVVVDDEIAIVGDALFGVFNSSVFPPFADDVQMMIRSWGRLLQTNCTTYLPGHGNPVSRRRLEKAYLKYNQLD